MGPLELETARQVREKELLFFSHDLRAPLASAVFLLESIRNSRKEKKDKSGDWIWVNTLDNLVKRALSLADNFLLLAQAGKLNAEDFVSLDVADILSEVMDEIWPQINVKKITLTNHFDCVDQSVVCGTVVCGTVGCGSVGHGTLVYGDGGYLHRAFANLLGNAARYSDPGTDINVWCAACCTGSSKCLEIRITNQATDAHIDYVLGWFSTRQRQPGNKGLGLEIAHTIVSQHGGSVVAERTADNKLSLIVRLPTIDDG